MPRVYWVDERAGVLGMERVQGWSVREVLGGGAEGEGESEGEGEHDPAERMEGEGLDDEGIGEGEVSEGMQALWGIGASQGSLVSRPGHSMEIYVVEA